MTVTKTALTVTSVAIAMMFGGGVYLMMNMNMIAKNYIERAATQTLGVKVSVGGLEILLKDRTAKATNITIDNPKGFESAYAAKIEHVNVALGALSQQLVTMKDVDVGGTVVNFEVRGDTTNLATIKNNIKVAPPSKEKELIKVIIDKMAMSGAQIKPVHVLFAEGELPMVNVPPIALSGIGTKENGVLANEAIAQIWTHISKKIETQAMQAGLLEGVSDEALKDMELGFRQRFQDNLKETVQEKVDTLGKNIDSMFNE